MKKSRVLEIVQKIIEDEENYVAREFSPVTAEQMFECLDVISFNINAQIEREPDESN